jgi:hypothetical protein
MSKFISNVKGFAKKNAPAELTILTIAGIGLVAFFSGKETLNASEKLKKAEEESEKKQREEQEADGVEPDKVVIEEMSNKEKLKIVAPCYKKTGAAILATSLCAGAAWKISENRVKSAVEMYLGLRASTKAFKEAVEENTTKKQKEKIDAQASEKMIKNVNISATPFVETGHGNLPFLFLYTNTPFHCNYEWLQKVQDELNSGDGLGVTINDIAYAIGIPEFDTVGDLLWFERMAPDDDPVKFDLAQTTKLEDGTPVTIVTFYDIPTPVPDGFGR